MTATTSVSGSTIMPLCSVTRTKSIRNYLLDLQQQTNMIWEPQNLNQQAYILKHCQIFVTVELYYAISL